MQVSSLNLFASKEFIYLHLSIWIIRPEAPSLQPMLQYTKSVTRWVIKPDVLEKDLIASLKNDGSITHFIGLMCMNRMHSQPHMYMWTSTIYYEYIRCNCEAHDERLLFAYPHFKNWQLEKECFGDIAATLIIPFGARGTHSQNMHYVAKSQN